MSRKALVIILVVALLVTLGAFIGYKLRHFSQRVIAGAIEKKETQVDLTALVTQVRELSRLETASMRVMHVSTITQSYGVLPDALAGDELTFLAVGDVIGGVDLAQIKREDVVIAPDGVLVMTLPPPQILVTRVDNSQSKVMNRSTGLLRKTDIHLESRARAHAEAGIRNEAIKKGILQLSSDNAQKKLADFLHAMGIQRVRFEPQTRQQPAFKG